MTKPIRTPSNGDEPELAADAPAAARVLVIDPKQLTHHLLNRRRGPQHIDVISASTADEGLELAAAQQPDAILLNAELPGADGFQVLSRLKSDPATNGLPVIMLSSSDDTTQKIRAFDMGAVDYISKPFDIAELRARLRSAVRQHRMIRTLAQQAQVDGLTGLFNRAYFDHRLNQEIAEAQRFNTRLALVMCDLDHFKTLNDTYGHPFGDHVLEVFAQILNSVRLSDIACRYGGEEFAVILPRAGAVEAAGVADRFREALQRFTWEGHPELRITASFGAADLRIISQPSARELVCAADEALYQAKQSGRNRVHIAGEHNAAHQKSA